MGISFNEWENWQIPTALKRDIIPTPRNNLKKFTPCYKYYGIINALYAYN